MTRTLLLFGTIAIAVALWMAWPRDAPTVDGAILSVDTESRVRDIEPLRATESDAVELTSALDTQASTSSAAHDGLFCHVALTIEAPSSSDVSHFEHILFEFGIARSLSAADAPLETIAFETAGTKTIRVPWHQLQASPAVQRPYVWLGISGPGVLPRRAFRRAPSRPGETVALSAEVLRGVAVQGRLVDVDGNPIVGHVRSDNPELPAQTTSGATGEFAIEFRGEGTCRLIARGTSRARVRDGTEQFDLGTGESEPLKVAFASPPLSVEIVVSGAGALRGRVVDAWGKPVNELWIFATAVETENEAHDGGGHVVAFTRTNALGAFELLGLQSTRFTLTASSARDGQRFSLADAPVLADGRPLDLSFTPPQLVVHVRDVTGAEVVLKNEGVARTGWFKATPTSPTLLALPSPPDNARETWPGLKTRTDSPGTYVITLDRTETTIHLGVFGEGVRWNPLRVDVPKDAERIDVDLLLEPRASQGILVLNASTRVDGVLRPLDESVFVSVLDIESDSTLQSHLIEVIGADTWPARLALPEGDYRVVVESGGHPLGKLHAQSFECPLSIVAGVETPLSALLEPSAVIHLMLHGAVHPADRSAAFLPRDEKPEESLASLIKIHLERDGRWHADLADLSKSRDAPSLPLYKVTMSRPTVPGTYTLVARMPGGRTRSKHVELVAGEITLVTFDFD